MDSRTTLKNLIAEKQLNNLFIIRFTANKHHHIGRYYRTTLRANKLHKYIGSRNSVTAIKQALQCPDDKFVKRFKKFGRVEFWSI
jgi:predicted cupin superfamily sugar epimerase